MKLEFVLKLKTIGLRAFSNFLLLKYLLRTLKELPLVKISVGYC